MAYWDQLIIKATEPARYVYFAFHYQRDIWRAQQIKNHWVTKESRKAAGYFDGSLEEKAKKEGDEAVKRMINAGMDGASVTCVLIGAETYTRRWVDYEILRSIEKQMGIFGVRIHGLKTKDGAIDQSGSNPFHYLGYAPTFEGSDALRPMILYNDGWKVAAYNGSINGASRTYFGSYNKPILENYIAVYDWVSNDGYNNFSKWVSDAAKQAGR